MSDIQPRHFKGSFIRWAGSKKRLVPKLINYWNEEYTRYIEPFVGSATLFFAIRPDKALLSDINPDLTITLKMVRNSPTDVYNSLKLFPLGEKAYYKIRKINSALLPDIDRAARFIYLNRFCFNGLFRTNLKGEFNVPYASSKTGRIPTINELIGFSKILSSAQINNCDFEDTLSFVQKGDFVYMDPPYAISNSRIFHQYGPNTFGIKDLKRLANLLPKIHNSGATFLVSYALCDEALEAFSGWNIERVTTQRSIAGFSHQRRKAIEILVSNKKVSHSLKRVE